MAKEIFAAVIDLETTGLDATLDVPLELGIKLIDKEGYVLRRYSSLILEQNDDFQRGVNRGRKNDFVREMHENSRLWKDLDSIGHGDLPSHSREEVDSEVCEWLCDIGVEKGKVPMMGNSIGSLDRPFVIRHFPKLNVMLSYRNIDMSSVRLLCEANNPPLYERIKNLLGDRTLNHRVLDDIDGCIAEYRVYRENFFFLED